MKTNELKKQVEKFGYYTEERPATLYVKAENDDVTGVAIAKVSKRNEGVMQIVSSEDLELVQVVAEYASTPLEEREEPKKYIYGLPLKVKGPEWHKTRHIIRDQGELWLDGSDRDYALNDEDFHFTDAEVEAYSEDIQALFRACEKEEVK